MYVCMFVFLLLFLLILIIYGVITIVLRTGPGRLVGSIKLRTCYSPDLVSIKKPKCTFNEVNFNRTGRFPVRPVNPIEWMKESTYFKLKK